MCSLEAQLDKLAGLDSAIPTHIGCGVRIAAGDISAPTCHHTRIAGVLPIELPAINRAGAFVGDANRPGETRSPVIDDGISAIARACHAGGNT